MVSIQVSNGYVICYEICVGIRGNNTKQGVLLEEFQTSTGTWRSQNYLKSTMLICPILSGPVWSCSTGTDCACTYTVTMDFIGHTRNLHTMTKIFLLIIQGCYI